MKTRSPVAVDDDPGLQPAPAAPIERRRVRLLVAGLVVDGLLRQKGEQIETDADTARCIAAAGRGVLENLVPIKIRFDNVLVGTHVCASGDVIAVAEEQAIRICNGGVAEPVDASALPGLNARRDPPPWRTRRPPLPPYHGEPTCRIKVIKSPGLLYGWTWIECRDEPHEVAQVFAANAVKSGAATYVGLVAGAREMVRQLVDALTTEPENDVSRAEFISRVHLPKE